MYVVLPNPIAPIHTPNTRHHTFIHIDLLEGASVSTVGRPAGSRIHRVLDTFALGHA